MALPDPPGAESRAPDSFLQSRLLLTASGQPICRLGLATRGTARLTPEDVAFAFDHGLNFWNWCGSPDGLSQAVAQLGRRRADVVVCVQFEARTAAAAEAELGQILRELQTDYVDVLTFYYVEEAAEWDEIRGPGGALDYCRRAQEAGHVRLLGLTSHQRRLAAGIAATGLIDLLMIRYNAAHRGAEQDIFPTTRARAIPVVAYTGLRWGALLQPTPDDPPGWSVPAAPAWYRFMLQSPDVTVALMAPETRTELAQDLSILDAAAPLTESTYAELLAHGDRVRRHAGQFP